MFERVKSFLFEYFWLPIIDPSVHYNVYNTIVYALIFSYVALYLVFPLVKKLDLSFDRRFFVAISPYVFLGGILRALRDHQVIDTILLETPIIYVLMFFYVLGILVISKFLEERDVVEYHQLSLAVGLLSLGALISLFDSFNFTVFLQLLILTLAWLITGLGVLYLLKPDLISYSFILPVAAHFLDATSTVVALGQGAEEKHVLANFFINTLGPYGMFVMKGLVIIPATYYIIKEFEGEERNYYLFLITLLGIALATRNSASIIF